MGMFDKIYVQCPGCGGETECQSKSGPCQLERYKLESAPTKVVAGILGGLGWTVCDHCERELIIELPKPCNYVVRLHKADQG